MALLCPSYDVACTVLNGRGIQLDVKAVRRLCSLAGTLDNGLRGRIALSGKENLHGYTLVISMDGGRLRERKRKRGRKGKGMKRHGYTSTGSAQVIPIGVSLSCSHFISLMRKATSSKSSNRCTMQRWETMKRCSRC